MHKTLIICCKYDHSMPKKEDLLIYKLMKLKKN